MEDILDSKYDENLINLFRLKNRVYNETFKSYIFIFNQIKNINFSSKIKYEDMYNNYNKRTFKKMERSFFQKCIF